MTSGSGRPNAPNSVSIQARSAQVYCGGLVGMLQRPAPDEQLAPDNRITLEQGHRNPAPGSLQRGSHPRRSSTTTAIVME
jgi:hypothetical protein